MFIEYDEMRKLWSIMPPAAVRIYYAVKCYYNGSVEKVDISELERETQYSIGTINKYIKLMNEMGIMEGKHISKERMFK